MQSRVQNTKRNIFASVLLMITQIVFQFLSRSVIVYALGANYLGLSSLFTSVLSVLNIAESGFSTSVIFFMYKPLAEDDTDTVCALLNYLRKVYWIVGGIILGVGLLITPFISLLIKSDIPPNLNIYLLYILYLLNTSISYFLFAYKTSLLTAIQRLDLTKIVNTIVILAQYIFQIITLIVFKNYYLFVIAMIFGTALVNIFTAYISKIKFPNYKCFGEIDDTLKKDISHKVSGMLICNISSVTYTSLDSIVISAFIGLSTVAIYNNYITIYSTISSVVGLIRASMQASVGNCIASETLERNYEDIKFWQFIFSLIATWCMTCLICLYQPFMKIWMGNNMMLPMIDVFLIGAWFLEGTVQHAFYLYLSGNGLWNEMKFAYIFSTIFNLIMNILLGKLLGVTGIILASLLASIVSGLFWQCPIIFRCYFKKSAKEYLLNQMTYFFKAAIVGGITFLICSFIKCGGILELVIKACLCFVLTTSLLCVVYSKSPYLVRAKRLLLTMIHT